MMRIIVKWAILLHFLFGFYACMRVVYESVAYVSCPRMMFAYWNAKALGIYHPSLLIDHVPKTCKR